MKLLLPDVTLVCVETREHELARLAVMDCLRVAEFGDVVILTDQPEKFSPMAMVEERKGRHARYHIVPDWPEKLGWSRAWWFDVPQFIRTRQTLNIQWDSWIVNPEIWQREFMDYDYIGAPWWYKDGKNVGNGGFSLVSARLKRFVADRRGAYPCDTNLDDDLLCRKYRHDLEGYGFRWAPEKMAHDFAFECCRPSHDYRSFGFHGMFNWPDVLDGKRLDERLEIALASPYIMRPDGHILKAFCEKNPDIARAITVKALAEKENPNV